ncbi:hypothetical protein F0310_04490 (plasmid) [Borrelia sp. A-FGy1]|uniref:hypothetical protein n=1 Tax=Borrelia sp. A-FGy1 TaxID=2608247 RepID=UPI0015F3E03D|nr:hypothetical protein [Borrelia sp. A-FGy1]QMU99676.1 hypothetical protein F0310_04490 [Borrelia sp. A-FGy1]
MQFVKNKNDDCLAQVSFIKTYLGFSPDFVKNGNGLIGKVDAIKNDCRELEENIYKELENLKGLLTSKLDRQSRINSAYYFKLFTELEQIKKTNISFTTFNAIGTFVVKVSAVVTSFFAILKLLGWV